jgi:hypothetical protein
MFCRHIIVTPTLNERIGENNWHVETTNPKKVLTVTAENKDEHQVIKAVEQAG